MRFSVSGSGLLACMSIAVFSGCASMPGPYELGQRIGPIEFGLPELSCDFFDALVVSPLQRLSDSTNKQTAPPASD